MVFAIERPISLTLKMAEKRENPEKIGDVGSHLISGGRPAKPLFYLRVIKVVVKRSAHAINCFHKFC